LIGVYTSLKALRLSQRSPVNDTIYALKESIEVSIKELAFKLDHHSSSNGDLQMEINNVSEAIDKTTQLLKVIYIHFYHLLQVLPQ